MKKIITLFVLFVNISTFAQQKCQLKKIPAVADLSCAAEKAYLYNILPKISIYNGFLFQEFSYCNYSNLDVNKTALRVDYCLPDSNYSMEISITDFDDPYYATKIGKPLKDVIFLAFQPSMISPFFYTYKSKNKNFDISIVGLPATTRGKPYVTFTALQNKRFYINIVIEGNKLKTANEVDEFIEEYTKSFNFPEK